MVRTNQLVWDLIAPSTQQIDKKLQYIKKSVITSAIIMTRTVNDMAKDESCGNSQWIDNYNDSLALLGHCNRQINLFRRDLIKPDLCWDSVHLCAHSLPYINFLFGDDVSKSAKEIETCNILGSRIFVVDKEVVEALDFADTQEVAVVVDAVAQTQEIHRMIDIRKMLTEPLGVHKTQEGGMRN